MSQGDHRLVRRKRLTPAAARRLVVHMALYSNDSGRYRTEAELAAFLSTSRLSLDAIVEEARDFSKPVPNFENLLGSAWQSSAGATVSVVDTETEGEYATVKGPGAIVMSSYWQDAELMWEALERAVDRCSLGDLLAALTHGVASVENYVNYRAQRWNFSHTGKPLEDSKANKVSLDTKIENWIPTMTGRTLDRGRREWSDFVALRRIRDDHAIHAKSAARAMPFSQMAEIINSTRTGVGGLLISLHRLFDEEIPARIIRIAFAPEVSVAQL